MASPPTPIPPTSTSITVSQSDLNIAPGESYYLRWTLNAATSKSGPGVAIDNFSLTVVPEPSPAPLLGLALCVCALGSRHFRRRHTA